MYLCNSIQRIDFREQIVRAKINAWDFDKGESIVNIGAWVLMPNHFHLYLTPNAKARLPQDANNVAVFMQKVLTAYSKYFNAKYGRTGALFEGKFKSVHVDNDNQAKYLFSYIHLNPIKLIDSNWKEEGIKDLKKSLEFLSKYKWSSYFDFQNISRQENKIIDLENFPKYFSNINDFDKEILTWLKYRNETI